MVPSDSLLTKAAPTSTNAKAEEAKTLTAAAKLEEEKKQNIWGP